MNNWNQIKTDVGVGVDGVMMGFSLISLIRLVVLFGNVLLI